MHIAVSRARTILTGSEIVSTRHPAFIAMSSYNIARCARVVIKPQYTKRGMGGSGVLEEMDVTEARRVLQKLVEARRVLQ
jgi:ABC-type ATPase with predicted acetyltransferase domain